MDVKEVICGISTGMNIEELVTSITTVSEKNGTEIQIHLCKTKIEVEYAVHRFHKNAVVLLQEIIEKNAPYEAWELAAIRDIGSVEVVVSVSRKHYGTAYMSTLYAAGILDAVYDDEAGASFITERLFARRNRKASREYYGIQSLEEVVKTMAVMPQETLLRYQKHIMGALDQEELFNRYLNIRKKLNFIENCYFAKNLPLEAVEELIEDPEFQKYQAFGEKKKGKRLFSK